MRASGGYQTLRFSRRGVFCLWRPYQDHPCGAAGYHRNQCVTVALQQLYFGNARADARIREFIAQARTAIDAPPADTAGRASSLDALVTQATPILDLLQAVTQAYQEQMQGCEMAVRKHQSDLVEHLSRISMQANIVAMNARVSAARAGAYGREFSVITQVLADITKEMDQLVCHLVGTSSRGTTWDRCGASIRRQPHLIAALAGL